MALLFAGNTFIAISSKNADFVDIFFLEFAAKLIEYIEINDHSIYLIDDQQPPYETLKTHIEINLANGFIWTSQLPAKALIFFVQKLDSNLRLYINYQRLTNFGIKNWYPLSLIKESLN